MKLQLERSASVGVAIKQAHDSLMTYLQDDRGSYQPLPDDAVRALRASHEQVQHIVNLSTALSDVQTFGLFKELNSLTSAAICDRQQADAALQSQLTCMRAQMDLHQKHSSADIFAMKTHLHVLQGNIDGVIIAADTQGKEAAEVKTDLGASKNRLEEHLAAYEDVKHNHTERLSHLEKRMGCTDKKYFELLAANSEFQSNLNQKISGLQNEIFTQRGEAGKVIDVIAIDRETIQVQNEVLSDRIKLCHDYIDILSRERGW